MGQIVHYVIGNLILRMSLKVVFEVVCIRNYKPLKHNPLDCSAMFPLPRWRRGLVILNFSPAILCTLSVDKPYILLTPLYQKYIKDENAEDVDCRDFFPNSSLFRSRCRCRSNLKVKKSEAGFRLWYTIDVVNLHYMIQCTFRQYVMFDLESVFAFMQKME